MGAATTPQRRIGSGRRRKLRSTGQAADGCDAPVCFLTGQRERVIGFDSLSGALRSFEHATYTSISGAGHYLPLEQPAVFAAVTQSWLAQCQALHVADSD